MNLIKTQVELSIPPTSTYRVVQIIRLRSLEEYYPQSILNYQS